MSKHKKACKKEFCHKAKGPCPAVKKTDACVPAKPGSGPCTRDKTEHVAPKKKGCCCG